MLPYSTTQKRTLHPVLGLSVCVCVCDSVLSAHSSFCCSRSRDADVLGVGVGTETLSACYIIYPFLLQTIAPCDVTSGDAVQRKDKTSVLHQEDLFSFCSSICLILQPDQHSRCSFMTLIGVVLTVKCMYLLGYTVGICL